MIPSVCIQSRVITERSVPRAGEDGRHAVQDRFNVHNSTASLSSNADSETFNNDAMDNTNTGHSRLSELLRPWVGFGEVRSVDEPREPGSQAVTRELSKAYPITSLGRSANGYPRDESATRSRKPRLVFCGAGGNKHVSPDIHRRQLGGRSAPQQPSLLGLLSPYLAAVRGETEMSTLCPGDRAERYQFWEVHLHRIPTSAT